MKKIAQSDFDEMAGRLRSRALRLMHQLEAATGYRADIETELARRVTAARGSCTRIARWMSRPNACPTSLSNQATGGDVCRVRDVERSGRAVLQALRQQTQTVGVTCTESF